MTERITHDQIMRLKANFQTNLTIGLIQTIDLLGLIAEVEYLQNANQRLRIAAQFVADSLRNEDSAIEAQAEAEGKLGIYNPLFVEEIRILLSALRNEP